MEKLIPLEMVMKNLPGLVGWKNIDRVYMGGNNTAAKVAGLKHPQDIAGLIDEEMPWQEYTNNICEMDTRILSGERITYVEPTKLIDESKWIIITRKVPISDENNAIKGIVFYSEFLTSTKKKKHTKLLTQFDLERFGGVPKQYEISEIFGGLSERESHCLFYLMRGKSMKATGEILSLSARTIETHIESIKSKLNCATKSDIIEKAIQLGYIHIIPKKLFGKLI